MHATGVRRESFDKTLEVMRLRIAVAAAAALAWTSNPSFQAADIRELLFETERPLKDWKDIRFVDATALLAHTSAFTPAPAVGAWSLMQSLPRA
jgi:hypothetical protein